MNQVGDTWRAFCKGLLDLGYPTRCALCGQLGDDEPCSACRQEMERRPDLFEVDTGDELDYRAAIFGYEGRASEAVRKLKYNRATGLAAYMAHEIAEAVKSMNDVDLVIPVPIHWSRRCSRGFNQAELLAAELPWRSDPLKRVRRTRPQAGLSLDQRRENLSGAFRAGGSVQDKTVLLIDDVVTSGNTAQECARVLRAAGAIRVGILAFCGESEPT